MSGIDRLEAHARFVDAGTDTGASQRRELSPVDEVRAAKAALRASGRRVSMEIDIVWLPVSVGIDQHPWKTLGLAGIAGATFGWLDEASHGAVSRLLWRVVRTGVSRAGLGLR